MMNTPICDFVRDYAKKNTLRLHMPGHKGAGALGVESLDITEIDGADVLYHSHGIIRESEENATSLFGTGRTVYSTEGSSLGIRAMVYLAMVYAKTQGKTPKILAGRNAHKTFMTAVALLDLEVSWLVPEMQGSMISCLISPEGLERALLAMEEMPVAVYLTDPDYLGNTLDLRSIAEVCHKYGVLLLVDNAHGAYRHFLSEPCHPIDLGADLCCDSAHKTLPVLTGGAYLHISKDVSPFFASPVYQAMSMFASTSPSYLTLQSLDSVNAYLSCGYTEKLRSFVPAVCELKERLRQQGFVLVGNEALKLTIAPKSYGYGGVDIAAYLEKANIVCEFADPDYVVMMLTPEIGIDALDRLETVLSDLQRREPVAESAPLIPTTVVRMSVREAMFSPSTELPVEQCVGRILADAGITCPPAIPVVICGEEITAEAVSAMQYYGITTCRVVCP